MALDVAWVEPDVFYAAHVSAHERSFWLDGSGARAWSGRMSYVGWLEPEELSLTWHAARGVVSAHGSGASREMGGDIFAAMTQTAADAGAGGSGVWVGYFGYAARTDLPWQPDDDPQALDACWLRPTRYVAFDHERRRISAVCPPAERGAWNQRVVELLISSAPTPEPAQHRTDPHVVDTWTLPEYRKAFNRVQDELRQGNSYETNLTFRTMVASTTDPVTAYLRLRDLSPAPYAALISHRGTKLLSSSPERFATIDASGWIETRPIKGTTPRSTDPARDTRAARSLAQDPKFRAENLITVDLLRNDLAHVCRPGSVVVTELMHVESYSTVHQLVSTIRGRLDPTLTSIEAIHAMLPGGSMTGAPKRRTMQIIAEVEATPRGAYAGAVGWLRDDGRADLGIIIRSLVWRDGLYTLGTGGAITVLSECAEEYAEAELKMQVMRRALDPGTGPFTRRPVRGASD